MKKLAALPLLLSSLLFFLPFATVSAQTTTLPSCVQKLTSLVKTSDPNKYTYRDSTFGFVNLFISNKRYAIVSTTQTGDWECSGEQLHLIGAVAPKPTNSATPATQTNPPATTQNQQTNPPANCAPNCPSAPSATQTTDLPLRIKLNNPLKVDTIQDAIKVFMDAVIKIAIPFIVVFFIWAGLQFILAQGNATKIQTAKKMFWYTVIGTLLILGAWAITDAIVGTINSLAS